MTIRVLYLTLVYILTFLFAENVNAQINWEVLSPIPEPVSNNAVTLAYQDGKPFLYSFAGIDTSKHWSGIHKKAFRFDITNNQWDTLPPLPFGNGRIAAAASTLKNLIYIIGGYEVFPTGNELSFDEVHVFDPEQNIYLDDAAKLPIAIDDHVQVVWRDSLIYVITGWSDNDNVDDVQVYNPTSNEWNYASPVPNNRDFKVFGASGVIVNDTIFYIGGARYGSNFPATTYMRKGVINPNNSLEISWSGWEDTLAKGYRMGAAIIQDSIPVWIGGSSVTYNYDAIAYNGSGPVSPNQRIITLNNSKLNLLEMDTTFPAIMDIRGMALLNQNKIILAGGMNEFQEVTDEVIQISIEDIPVIIPNRFSNIPEIKIYPNPASNYIFFEGENFDKTQIFDIQGKLIFEIDTFADSIDTNKLKNGAYFIMFYKSDEFIGWAKFQKSN